MNNKDKECCENCNFRIRKIYSDSNRVDYYCGLDCRYPKLSNRVNKDHVCENYKP